VVWAFVVGCVARACFVCSFCLTRIHERAVRIAQIEAEQAADIAAFAAVGGSSRSVAAELALELSMTEARMVFEPTNALSDEMARQVDAIVATPLSGKNPLRCGRPLIESCKKLMPKVTSDGPGLDDANAASALPTKTKPWPPCSATFPSNRPPPSTPPSTSTPGNSAATVTNELSNNYAPTPWRTGCSTDRPETAASHPSSMSMSTC
jgi:hypothetical protein